MAIFTNFHQASTNIPGMWTRLWSKLPTGTTRCTSVSVFFGANPNDSKKKHQNSKENISADFLWIWSFSTFFSNSKPRCEANRLSLACTTTRPPLFFAAMAWFKESNNNGSSAQALMGNILIEFNRWFWGELANWCELPKSTYNYFCHWGFRCIFVLCWQVARSSGWKILYQQLL